jgi:hypothetical protein
MLVLKVFRERQAYKALQGHRGLKESRASRVLKDQ